MDMNEYMPYWDAAKGPMIAALAEIESRLGSELVGFYCTDPYQGGDEEFKMCMDINDAAGDVIASLEFTLFDADVNGGDAGVGVGLDMVGYNAMPLAGYFPGRYTAEAFTTDIGEMLERINSVDMEGFVAECLAGLNDPLLRAEFERDKKTPKHTA